MWFWVLLSIFVLFSVFFFAGGGWWYVYSSSFYVFLFVCVV